MPSLPRPLIAALVLSTFIKLLLAWFTVGTNDVVTWLSFAHAAQSCGACVYHSLGPYGDPFNHPPFIIHFLKLLPTASGLFPFWLRLPSIVADIGAVFLVHRLAPSLPTYTLTLLAANPVSILISGFQGKTDPVMVFFLLAAILFASKDKSLLAGLAFGMALNIKAVPLLFVPCFLLYLGPLKRKAVFCATLIAAVGLLSLPYILHGSEVMKSVLGYRGLFTNWGVAHYADLAGLQPVNLLTRPFQYLMFGVSVVLPWYLRRRDVPLIKACAAVMLSFYVLTPSLALQYLVWAVPFVAMLGLRSATIYYALASSLIALQYHRCSGGRWIFADSHSVLPVTAETELLSFALWVCCITLFALLVYHFHDRTITGSWNLHSSKSSIEP